MRLLICVLRKKYGRSCISVRQFLTIVESVCSIGFCVFQALHVLIFATICEYVYHINKCRCEIIVSNKHDPSSAGSQLLKHMS